MGNRIYGCDDCLAVCPGNKFAVAGREVLAARRAEPVEQPDPAMKRRGLFVVRAHA